MPPRTTGGYPPLYVLSTLLFLFAICGIAALIGSDLAHRFSDFVVHQRLDALPLIAIGMSYISVHVASSQSRRSLLQGVFLGTAFLLWGGEQLLPQSRLTTFMDEGAVTIFVVDVSLIVWKRISLGDHSQSI